MTIASYKDLCLDAASAGKLGAFWAAAVGLESQLQPGGDGCLVGPTPQHTIWVNQVPEPKAAKHRVHLDVRARSVADLEELGAVVLDADSFPWAVMADPEGGEFCVFLRHDPGAYRLYEVVVDCRDHQSLSAWWQGLVGGHRVVEADRGFSYLDDVPDMPFEALVFVPVPEPKTVKNRIHLDVTTTDLPALVAAGATLLRASDSEIAWNVMTDPEGNEFCAFVDDRGVS